jgi:hypothetical protein
MTAEARTSWGIPAPEFTELEALFGNAQGLLQKAQSSDRTPVITGQCREDFEALDGKMRFFKGRYFLIPPLTNADIADLGLTPRDTRRTSVPKPEAQVEADLTFPGIHLVELQNIRAVGTYGLPDPPGRLRGSRLLRPFRAAQRRFPLPGGGGTEIRQESALLDFYPAQERTL